jgi:hypothetical protein
LNFFIHLKNSTCFNSIQRKNKKKNYIYNEKRGRNFHQWEVPMIAWRVTSMCQKVFCQVVHEIGFLIAGEGPKYTQEKKYQRFTKQ